MKSSCALHTTCNEIAMNLIAVVEEVYSGKCTWHKVLGEIQTLQEKSFHQLALMQLWN